MNTSQQTHRDTIAVEQCAILSHDAFAGDQFIMRVQAPQIAAEAQAGQFAHISCAPQVPLRRPISIMRVDRKAGWVEFLYKVFGQGTRLLSQHKPGETISIIGPIGVPFNINPQKPKTLLIGGGVGIPPMIFLVDAIRQLNSRANQTEVRPFVIMGSEVPFPFDPRPSQIMVPGMPDGVIGAMPLLEDWGVASRLTSLQGYAGCFDGYVTDLARHWLETMDTSQHTQVEIFACGPHPMLAAVAKLAKEFGIACQVSLEEFMACAVGGCAGCTVEVQTEQGPAMKRVCVDGPVFDAYRVFTG